MWGRPRLKTFFPRGRCEAKNVNGKPCGCRVVYLTKAQRKLCRFHGGSHYHRISMGKPIVCTGPRTPEGKRIALQNLVQNRKRSNQRESDNLETLAASA